MTIYIVNKTCNNNNNKNILTKYKILYPCNKIIIFYFFIDTKNKN